jgi:NAD(P)-dependent dehydrogenase (short-subunit alcohol dehydrogenase family)
MVKKGLEKFGKIDILVHNAGASSELKPFIEMTKVRDWTLPGSPHGRLLSPADYYRLYERRPQ